MSEHQPGERVVPADLETWRELERVLTSTRFVTADDLVADGPIDVPITPCQLDRVELTELPGERTPLPRRR